MNKYQKSINQWTKYFMTNCCDRSFYKLRKRVRIVYKNWIKKGF